MTSSTARFKHNSCLDKQILSYTLQKFPKILISYVPSLSC